MSDESWLVASRAVPIRQLTEPGIERFHTYLMSLKDGALDPFPSDLLTDNL